MFRITNGSLAATLCLALALSAGACSQNPGTTGQNQGPNDQNQNQAQDQTQDQNKMDRNAQAPVQVTAVELGSDIGGDKHVTQKAEQFKPDDVVYVTVMTTGESTEQTNLKARWTDDRGKVIDESEKNIAPKGDEATEFHISKPDGLPVGKYKVEIFVNGESVESKNFEVVRA